MHKYRLISKKGEGTFSEVLKAQSIKSNKYLAIKCMKNHFESIDQVNNLREIQALRRLSPNPGVIKLYEVLYDQPTGRLALVFELMDMNIYELIRGRRHYLPEARVKQYMYQLIKSMDHMHRNGIFHRDVKPENILISDDILKVADFGSCRGIYSKQPYTEYISTRWYRAPECLLTDGYYGYKMDMWGVGCVMFEIIALFPLFPGTNELDQIERIHNIVGTPPKEILEKFKKYATHIEFNFADKAGTGIGKLIPHADAVCIDLITKLLAYDPENRLSARQALRHPYFQELRQADKQRERAAKKQTQVQQQQASNNVAEAKAASSSSSTHQNPQQPKMVRRKLKQGKNSPTRNHEAGYGLPNLKASGAGAGVNGKNSSNIPLPSISHDNHSHNYGHSKKSAVKDVRSLEPYVGKKPHQKASYRAVLESNSGHHHNNHHSNQTPNSSSGNHQYNNRNGPAYYGSSGKKNKQFSSGPSALSISAPHSYPTGGFNSKKPTCTSSTYCNSNPAHGGSQNKSFYNNDHKGSQQHHSGDQYRSPKGGSTYKSKATYQSPYSQRYIARQRVIS